LDAEDLALIVEPLPAQRLAENLDSLFEALGRAVEEFRCVVLLKGEGTLVGAAGAGPLVCGGFPSLATAGTGDVLTGVIASFLAKGMDARLAAAAGATAHTQAAVAAPHRSGLVAGDLLGALPRVLDA
jgi:NAD(P)H-hydrate repair Nnr-like enzyme with NAD(P)H-hydrate dehydratase domain